MRNLTKLIALFVCIQVTLWAKYPPFVGKPDQTGLHFYNLFINRVAPDKAGNLVLSVAGNDGNTAVGVDIVLGKSWRPPLHSADRIAAREGAQSGQGMAIGKITLRSIGNASNALVEALARSMGITLKKARFHDMEFNAILLGGGLNNLQTRALDFKLTDGAMDTKYSDLLCHIDIKKHFVQLQEEYNNPRWRRNLIEALTRTKAGG
ncbi:hypothetical protein GALL_276140 [mine drainage metagenome]|uniref:Uncharacterized protein n=1 Tax=mine drainage metagenome TaxID=410659 RepID=A0A1J5RLR8_9ZZZZ